MKKKIENIYFVLIIISKMKVINALMLIFIINVSMIFGYNLDTKTSLTLKYENSSYFGYSIILHKSAVIIGAPKDNYSINRGSEMFPHEPGAVWKYIFDTHEWQQFRSGINDEIGFIKDKNLTVLIMKKNGWFGASIALQDVDDVLTICAPRTMMSFISEILGQLYKIYSMHGICYTGKFSTGELRIDDPNLSFYDFSTSKWANPLRGFSVYYPSSWYNHTKNDTRMITGSVNHEDCGSVKIESEKSAVFLSKNDDMTRFGYAVSSGRFFDKNQLLYVGGGPGWDLVGQVAIMDSNMEPRKIIQRLNGNTIGEYFGASLAVGDINNDGLDDLIIGAPHWGNDNGRVYIYLGNKNGFSKAKVVLNGYLDDSLFGYAITSGDLDADGFDDLIVGAPYENDGTIYVYNGDSKINQEIYKKFQRIQMNSRIKTFGFSLAKPIDTDANGFPDVGVGAYKSGHAVILKTRPVIKTNIRMLTIPNVLYQNSTNIVVKICVQHIERDFLNIKGFNLTLNIDESFKRLDKSQVILEYIPSENMPMIAEVCLNTTLYILEYVEKNYIDPIDIVVIHKFEKIQRLNNKIIGECELCPIEVKGELSKTSQLSLPFDLGCGLDEICSAIIELQANVHENKSTWIIGSEDIMYEVYIKNYGEPAYSTEIILELPEKISLRSYLPFCKHSDLFGILKIKCDVKNPLTFNSTEKIEFILDMSQLNDGSLNGSYLHFNVSVKTRSNNDGTENISTSILLLSDIVTVIEGNIDDKNYYYTLNDEIISNINIYHSYKISKSGATPINEAILCVDVPIKFNELELITLANIPNIHISGKMYECSVINIPIFNKQKNIIPLNLKGIAFQQKIMPMYNSTFYNITEKQRISLDCLSLNVTCGRVICDISLLKSLKDSAILQLEFLVNLKLLMDRYNYENNEYIIQFTTQASIGMIKPLFGLSNVTEVNTVFYQIEKLKRLYLWIIIGSILLGLIVLFIMAIILWKLGFFRRKKKEAVESKEIQSNADSSMHIKDKKF